MTYYIEILTTSSDQDPELVLGEYLKDFEYEVVGDSYLNDSDYRPGHYSEFWKFPVKFGRKLTEDEIEELGLVEVEDV